MTATMAMEKVVMMARMAITEIMLLAIAIKMTMMIAMVIMLMMGMTNKMSMAATLLFALHRLINDRTANSDYLPVCKCQARHLIKTSFVSALKENPARYDYERWGVA